MSLIFKTLAATAGAGLLMLGLQAQGVANLREAARAPAPAPVVAWDALRLGDAPRPPAAAPAALPAVEATPAVAVADTEIFADIDVVDAHWMALTMWGEARSDGEEGMRAVGHVIDNRRRARHRSGRYVTDTVSAAWQFSCWNRGDPNRAAMMNIDALPEGSREHDLWLAAKRLAAEILAGRSADPTGGALFYHTAAVAPGWSRGVPPVSRIGRHIFFRTAL